jgi:hypothetical protein
MTSTIVAASDTADAYLTDVSLVDGSVGYLTYYTHDPHDVVGGPCLPHLLTWDGSCWTDQSLDAMGPKSLVVEADRDKRPWVVWGDSASGRTQSIRLRSPDGSTEDVFTALPDLVLGMAVTPPRLLPGGIDGTAAYPAVAVKDSGGIRVATRAGSGWSQRLLSESADGVTSGDCPVEDGSMHPCLGLASCTEQLSGASTGFDHRASPRPRRSRLNGRRSQCTDLHVRGLSRSPTRPHRQPRRRCLCPQYRNPLALER